MPILFQIVKAAPSLWSPQPPPAGALGSEILVGGPAPPGKGVLVMSWVLTHANSSPLRRGAPDPGAAGWKESLSPRLADPPLPLLLHECCICVPTSSLSLSFLDGSKVPSDQVLSFFRDSGSTSSKASLWVPYLLPSSPHCLSNSSSLLISVCFHTLGRTGEDAAPAPGIRALPP